ncbi:hypothetical protein AGMMS50256_35780 [Betaproteobacteria bacterium]|nr:hypothetical protein AGMMS50256_35780 [Betaproteobacteria bacterium]
MPSLSFTWNAWEDYIYWQTQDRGTLARINKLIAVIGKPEPLSDRIDDNAELREPKPVIDWTGKVPDREISSTGWIPQLLASTKEKVRSLADITGLFFPSNREERP